MEEKIRIALSMFVFLSAVGQLTASTCYSSPYRFNARYGITYYLSSPNYPFNYYSNQNCYWYIAAPSSNMVIKVTFTYFNLQQSSSCSKDYIEVRDGRYSYSTFISRYCGTKIPPVIISKGAYLYIKFRSDYLLQYGGFRLAYTAVYPVSQSSGKCSSSYTFAANNNIRLTSDRGTIYSPSYPFNYPNNMQCTWKIAVTSGKKIRLTFDYMNMESSIFCSNDYLQVRDGYYSMSLKKGDYCGSTRKTIYSTGRYLWIRFRSNHQYNYKGFKLSYSVQQTSSPSTGSSSTGSSSTGLIIGVLIAVGVIIGIIVGVAYCAKKRSRGVVVHNAAPSVITATTVATNAPPDPIQGGVNLAPQGPPPYGQADPYPQKGQAYQGPPPLGQPNPYPGPPPMGQPNPYPGPPPMGQPNPYPGPPPYGQADPYPQKGQAYQGPPPLGQPNPYPGPPPMGQPNPYPGPPPMGQPNPYPGPPPMGQPNPYPGPPPMGQPNPYPGPPPMGQPNPYPGPPPLGQPNQYPGPPPMGQPNPYPGPPPP